MRVLSANKSNAKSHNEEIFEDTIHPDAINAVKTIFFLLSSGFK